MNIHTSAWTHCRFHEYHHISMIIHKSAQKVAGGPIDFHEIIVEVVVDLMSIHELA